MKLDEKARVLARERKTRTISKEKERGENEGEVSGLKGVVKQNPAMVEIGFQAVRKNEVALKGREILADFSEAFNCFFIFSKNERLPIYILRFD